jgi:hypothetical protein
MSKMNLPDVTTPRLTAALAELNRQREQMAAHYPAMVQASKLTAADAETRIQAIADAAIVVAAALAAMEQRAAIMGAAAKTAATGQTAAGPAAATGETAVGPTAATESSASVFRPLPYAQGETIEGQETEVVKCRFCGAACVRSLSKSLTVESWKCSLSKCRGSIGWVHRSTIEAPRVTA